jgi:hypothetical protein
MSAATIRERVAALVQADPALAATQAERIAALECEVETWKERAHTDPISGLLNERAHLAVRQVVGKGHGSWRLDDVQAVYDRCRQGSGDAYIRDLAAIIQEEADRCGVQAFRVGTAKLAFLAQSVAAMKVFVSVLAEVLGSVRVTCKASLGAPLEHVCVPGPALVAFLAEHAAPIGLDVRATRPGEAAASRREVA